MEGIRSWFGRQIEKMTATYEEAMVKEAKMLEDLVAHSDSRKRSDSITNDPLNRERVSFNTRVTQVDMNDRLGMFIPAWKALYLEKQGKLARVGYYQHVEIDESTVFTRARAAKNAADEAGIFLPN